MPKFNPCVKACMVETLHDLVQWNQKVMTHFQQPHIWSKHFGRRVKIACWLTLWVLFIFVVFIFMNWVDSWWVLSWLILDSFLTHSWLTFLFRTFFYESRFAHTKSKMLEKNEKHGYFSWPPFALRLPHQKRKCRF